MRGSSWRLHRRCSKKNGSMPSRSGASRCSKGQTAHRGPPRLRAAPSSTVSIPRPEALCAGVHHRSSCGLSDSCRGMPHVLGFGPAWCWLYKPEFLSFSHHKNQAGRSCEKAPASGRVLKKHILPARLWSVSLFDVSIHAGPLCKRIRDKRPPGPAGCCQCYLEACHF